MNKNHVKTNFKFKYKRWICVTYFARDALRSYFYDPQKNEIYFLNAVSQF